ncbi:MAG: hypothetical protein R2789_06765 [Microthrixaceae bacterium]
MTIDGGLEDVARQLALPNPLPRGTSQQLLDRCVRPARWYCCFSPMSEMISNSSAVS